MSVYVPGRGLPAVTNNYSSFIGADALIPTSTAQQTLLSTPAYGPGVYVVSGIGVCSGATVPGGLAMLLAYPGVAITEIDSWIPDAHPHFISGSGIATLTTPQSFIMSFFGDGVLANCTIKRVAPVSNFYGGTLFSVAQIG